MTRIIRFAALTLIVVATQSAPPPAPRGVPSADGTIRFSSDFVQMDVVVTDSKGRSVLNLEPADFDIREDGKLQTIAAFSYISRRTIVFIADDCDAFAYGLVSTAPFLKDFVDRRMQPDDSISIVPSTGGAGAFLRLTGDKQQLHDAIDRFDARGFLRVADACRPQNNKAYEIFSVQGERDQTGRLSRYVYDLAEPYHGASFSALSLAIEGMASLPGRKNVILLSSGFGWLPFKAGTPAVQELADRANRAGVTVYVLDAGEGDEAFSADDPARTGKNLRLSGVDYLARATGGLVVRYMGKYPFASDREYLKQSVEQRAALDDLKKKGLSIIDAANNEVVHRTGLTMLEMQRKSVLEFLIPASEKLLGETQGYYLIGYKPSRTKGGGAAKSHTIQVKVRRGGLNVRSRKGYSDTSDIPSPAAPSTREAQLQAALRNPFGATDIRFEILPVDSSPGKDPQTGRRGYNFKVMMAAAASDLRFEDQPDGTKRASVDVVAAAYNRQGEPVARGAGTCSMSATAGEIATGKTGGLPCSLDLPLDQYGSYTVRAAVMDRASGKTGSAYAFAPLWNYDSGRMVVTPLVLSSYPPKGSSSGTDPMTRVFAPGETIAFTAYVYGAKRDRATGKPKLDMNLSFDRRGGPVSRSQLSTVQVEGTSDPVVVVGRLALSPDQGPGNYNLALSVFDRLDSRRPFVVPAGHTAIDVTITEPNPASQ